MIGKTRYSTCLSVLVILVTFLLLEAWPLAIYAAHDAEDIVDTVTPERVKFYLDNKEVLVIIDLRTTKEFQERRLPGSSTRFPVQEREQKKESLPLELSIAGSSGS